MTALRASAAALLLCACGSAAAGGGSVSSGASTNGELSGTVVAAPMCPVQRDGAPCPPRPVAGAQVVAAVGPRTVATTTTDPAGRFALRLPRGRYVVTATNPGGYPSRVRTSAQVGAAVTIVRLVLDSGIR